MAEGRSTPHRVDAVTSLAKRDPREEVRSLAVRVLSGYKDSPETVALRGQVFQTLVEVAKGKEFVEARCQALMALGRERQPSDSLVEFVRNMSANDPAENVRSAAGHVLRRWESP